MQAQSAIRRYPKSEKIYHTTPSGKPNQNSEYWANSIQSWPFPFSDAGILLIPHVHVESSMLVPSEFARLAVVHW